MDPSAKDSFSSSSENNRREREGRGSVLCLLT
jgi:hypothetical protein